MKNIRGFILGVVTTLIIFSLATTVYAASSGKTIDIVKGIKLFLNGNPLEMADVSGNVVEPFIHDGTTYVPVRGLAEALGKSVAWDSKSNSVYIDEPLSSEARHGVSKIIVRHWYFGNVITGYIIDFQSCQLTTDGYDGWTNTTYYASAYMPSERHEEFFEAVERYGFLNWNDPDWVWHNTWDDIPSDDGSVAVPPEDGAYYDISVIFSDGSEWKKSSYEAYPDGWNEMKKAFIDLTEKNILIYDATGYAPN